MRKKLCASESHDYISNLPDDVISLILSRLLPSEAETMRRVLSPNEWTPIVFWCLESCTLNLSSKTCFAKLESLGLCSFNEATIIRNKQFPNTSRLLLNFPVLKYLVLGNCKWLDVDYVEIQAPELIKLTVISFEGDAEDCEIKICGAKLRRFMSSYYKIDNFVVTAPAITHASLDHSDTDNLGLRAGVLLKEFRNLKFLNLSGQVFRALVKSKSKSKSEPEPLLVFSSFHQLKELELKVGRAAVRINGNVLKLLETLPSLESIKIKLDGDSNSGKSLQCQKRCIIIPRLKYVEITGFNGGRNGFDLVRLILMNAKKLENIYVYVYHNSEEIRRQLLELKPQHSNCVIHTTTKTDYNDTDERRHKFYQWHLTSAI